MAAASARAVADGLLRRDVGALVDARAGARSAQLADDCGRALAVAARAGRRCAWSSLGRNTTAAGASRRLSTRSAGSARRPPQMPLPPKARGGGAVEGGAHNY